MSDNTADNKPKRNTAKKTAPAKEQPRQPATPKKKTTTKKPSSPEPTENTKTKKKAPAPGRDASGRFVKGRAKTGGRGLGVGNTYGNVRDRLKDIIMPYLNAEGDGKSLATDLMAIDDPKDRIDAVAKMLPFVVPKYSSTTINADNNRPIAEEQRLLELDQQYKKADLNIKSLPVIDNDQPAPSTTLTKKDLGL